MPHTSLISIGAIFPRKTLARKLDAREILHVAAYTLGFFLRNLRICGPVKRYCQGVQCMYVMRFGTSNISELLCSTDPFLDVLAFSSR
jgi:hypothetical protein